MGTLNYQNTEEGTQEVIVTEDTKAVEATDKVTTTETTDKVPETPAPEVERTENEE